MGEVDTGKSDFEQRAHVFEVEKAVPPNDFGYAPFSQLPQNVIADRIKINIASSL